MEQPVLLANLQADGRHVVLAGRDEAHAQHLAIYALDSLRSSNAKPLITLHPESNLIAYDVGRLGDEDVLLFIEPGRVSRFDLASREFIEILKIQSIYGQQRTGDIVPNHLSGIGVEEVIDRWLDPQHRYFKLRGDDGGIYILRQDVPGQTWDMTLFDSGSRDETRLSST